MSSSESAGDEWRLWDGLISSRIWFGRGWWRRAAWPAVEVGGRGRKFYAPPVSGAELRSARVGAMLGRPVMAEVGFFAWFFFFFRFFF
jgi:hypothetical protein